MDGCAVDVAVSGWSWKMKPPTLFVHSSRRVFTEKL